MVETNITLIFDIAMDEKLDAATGKEALRQLVDRVIKDHFKNDEAVNFIMSVVDKPSECIV